MATAPAQQPLPDAAAAGLNDDELLQEVAHLAVLHEEAGIAVHAREKLVQRRDRLVTAEMVKSSINNMVDGMGQRENWKYHFMLHQFVSNTPTALEKVEARKQGGMDAVKKEQSGAREKS